MFATLGGFGVWYITDLIMIALGKFTILDPLSAREKAQRLPLSEQSINTSIQIFPDLPDHGDGDVNPTTDYVEKDEVTGSELAVAETQQYIASPNIRRIPLSFSEKWNFVVTDSKEIKRLKNEHRLLTEELSYSLRAMRIYEEDILPFLDPATYKSKGEKGLIAIGNCKLIEVRKGARVSDRNSTYSGSSRGGSIRVGRVRVGGSRSHGSSSSTSVSYPAPDVLQVIDVGNFLLTSKKISFAGSKFTKTTEFKKILDFDVDGLELLITPSTGSKIWICEFPALEWQWLATTLLQSGCESENKTLDSKTETIYGKAENLVHAIFTKQLSEIRLEINGIGEALSEVLERHAEYEAKYENRVTDFRPLR